ncbi:hypothetical protein COBT_004191, partial [Conglomerata obtusa]
MPSLYGSKYMLNFFQNAYNYRSNQNINDIEIFDQNSEIKIEYHKNFNDYKASYFMQKVNNGSHYMLIDNFALNELDYAAMLRLFSIPKRIENKLDQYVYFIVLNFKENSTLKHNF